MAVNKGFSIDFNGFLDLAEDISSISNETLLGATVKALDESRKIVNIAVGSAMKESQYNFKKGEGYSQGDARASLIEVSQMPVEVSGTVVTAYAGVDLEKAPEVLMLASGTPHLAKDKKLYNAIKVKGKVKEEVNEVQKDIFTEALKEALGNG
jgi:hypothetical protein